MNKMIEGMTEALAIAKGEKPAAAVTIGGHRYVPASDPLADGMLTHYLSQSRSAEQVRRIERHAVRMVDEDDGA